MATAVRCRAELLLLPRLAPGRAGRRRAATLRHNGFKTTKWEPCSSWQLVAAAGGLVWAAGWNGLTCQASPDSESFAALEMAFPDADRGELARFARARRRNPKAAVEMYAEHVRWRGGAGQPQLLAEAFERIPSFWIDSNFDGNFASDGSRIILLSGARYDLSIAASDYTSAICHTLDRTFGENQQAQATVIVDARAGEGWPNPGALKLLPFLRDAAFTIPNHYPERLKCLIFFPLPPMFVIAFKSLVRLLDPVTAEKLVVLSGGTDAIGAPCPAEQLRLRGISLASLPCHAHERFSGLL